MYVNKLWDWTEYGLPHEHANPGPYRTLSQGVWVLFLALIKKINNNKPV